MDINTSRGAKGISPGEWRHKSMLLPRQRLSDITNLSNSDFNNGVVNDAPENRKTGSPAMVNEYIAKLFRENNVLMRALAERNTEVQNLRLMVAKLNQQNLQLAQGHSQMLAELNLGKDRLKAAQHELGCTSTALKVKTQELEEQKKLNKQSTQILEGRIKPVDTAVETSQLVSHERSCLPNRKRPQRTLVPAPVANQITTEEDNRRRLRRRKSNVLKAESCVLPPEDLFEIEDATYPICLGENKGEIKNGGCSLQPKPFAPTIPTKSVKKEDEDVQVTSSLNRTSLGRPLRRAAEKVNCYKELPLNTKLRRSE